MSAKQVQLGLLGICLWLVGCSAGVLEAMPSADDGGQPFVNDNVLLPDGAVAEDANHPDAAITSEVDATVSIDLGEWPISGSSTPVETTAGQFEEMSAAYPDIIAYHSCVGDPTTEKIYCLGGVDKATTNAPETDQIVEYDPQTDIAHVISETLPDPRTNHSCARSSVDGKIYCFGGKNQQAKCLHWESWGCTVVTGGQTYLLDVVAYTPAEEDSGTVEQMSASIPQGVEHVRCVNSNVTNLIYCFGGRLRSGDLSDAIFTYDPQKDEITTLDAVLPVGINKAACVESSADKQIYCLGGQQVETIHYDGTHGYMFVQTIVKFDPVTHESTTLEGPKMPLPYWGPPSCVNSTISNTIFCFGIWKTGSDNRRSDLTGEVIQFDPVGNTSQMMDAALSTPRNALSCVEDTASPENIYCVGGAVTVTKYGDIVNFSL